MIRRRKWIKTVAFLLGFVLLLQGLSWLFIVRGSGNRNAMSILRQEENTLDYLVMGDSECYSSVSPMEIWKDFGFAGYNCGVIGQHIQYTYYLLEQILAKQSPHLVLLETNALFRSSSGGGGELETVVDNAAASYFPLLQYHNGWQKIRISDISQFRPFEKASKNDILKGFHYRPQIVPYTGGEYMTPTDKVREIEPIPLHYLNCIADLCEEKGIRLILYSSPSPDNWNYRKHNGVEQYVQERQITFLDLNLKTEELGIDWSKDTTDRGDHLSFPGAKKVSAYIGKWLSENTGLQDMRSDERYVSWDEMLPEYLKRTGQNRPDSSGS